MTQYGAVQIDVTGTTEVRTPCAPQYLMCRQCVKRVKLSPELQALEALGELRCDCGAHLHDCVEPAELSASPRGVLPRLIRFWRAGREDGFWSEKRFLRPATAERAGVAPRQARFAYESGRRAGERIRQGAHLHMLRVMRMKGAAGATVQRAA
jgi:hypothetical protein